MTKAYYFSHNGTSRSDIRIKKIIKKFGVSAYGYFWALLEELFNNGGFLEKEDALIPSGELFMGDDEASSILEMMIFIGLIKEEDGMIFSPDLLKEMEGER